MLALTGSPSQAGLVGFAQTLPFPLLFLVAGVVVDRVDRKRLLLVADGARAVAFASLVVALALDRVVLAHILAVAFVEGAGIANIFGPIFNVVLSAYRYALVPDRLLGRVGSVILLVAWGTIPLGAISAGFLLEGLGAVTTMLVLAGVNVGVALGATVTRTVRNVPPVDELRVGYPTEKAVR